MIKYGREATRSKPVDSDEMTLMGFDSATNYDSTMWPFFGPNSRGLALCGAGDGRL